MAVSQTLNLPAQPASGFYRVQPLGGDGSRGPYREGIGRFDVTGDASGGAQTALINLDLVYAQMVASVNVRLNQAPAAADVAIRLSAGGGPGINDVQQVGRELPVISGPTGANAFMLWTPHPVLIDARETDTGNNNLQIVTTNVTNMTMEVNFRLLYWKKGIRELTPMEILATALGRTSNID